MSSEVQVQNPIKYKQTETELQEVSGTLTEKRREKLLALKKREEMKDVLIKKFKERVSACGLSLTAD